MLHPNSLLITHPKTLGHKVCYQELYLSFLMGKKYHNLYIDYAHLQAHSAVVKEGQEVQAGEILAKSGGSGFCPNPHLHVQVNRGGENDAPSVPFAIRVDQFYPDDSRERVFYPKKGLWFPTDAVIQPAPAA